MAHFLGLDIGTSATKALLCDGAGAIVSTASAEYELLQVREGWSEQRPQDWWSAACKATRAAIAGAGVSPSEILAVGLTGQMHGSVLLGADAAGGRGEALRNALLWNDQRTQAECREIEEALGGRRATVQRVGNAALPGFTLPKLLWVRKHEPETWAKVRHVLLPKDFIAYLLTGVLASDVGDASGTLLFDVDTRGWSAEMCRELMIDPGLLPAVHESASIVGHITAGAAAATGLAPKTPVIIGSGDNMAGAIGAGVVTTGAAVATLGTSGVIYAHADSPRRDLPADTSKPCGRIHTMCAATGTGGWCVTGCMLAAGLSLRWARDTLAPGVSYEAILAEAQTAPVGCEGLVFLPHLTGERCPHPDPKARGGFVGLTARHTRAHLFRAVIEGITFSLGQIVEIMREAGVRIESVRLSGGGNRSAFWRQLQADVFACPVCTTNSEAGGGAFGAAMLGAAGVGAFPSVGAAAGAMIKIGETRAPNIAMVARLEECKREFARVYPAVRGLWMD